MDLFLQVETDGLPLRRDGVVGVRVLSQWPRVIQYNWAIAERREIVKRCSYCVAGIQITRAESIRYHGITQERLDREGVAAQLILQELSYDLQGINNLITFNYDFHGKVVMAELMRLGMPVMWDEAQVLDTMLIQNPLIREQNTSYMSLNSLYTKYIGGDNNKSKLEKAIEYYFFLEELYQGLSQSAS